ALRAQLAVTSARQSLVSHWDGDGSALREVLEDITRDKRIMSAAACSGAGRFRAATATYPADFSCSAILSRLIQEHPAKSSIPWFMTPELPGGAVHLSVVDLPELPERGFI